MNNSKILEEDFSNITRDLPTLGSFKNASILITGATGFIGSFLARYFIYLNTELKMNIRIIVLVRNMDKANLILGKHSCEFIVGDLLSISKVKFPEKLDYIFHCAAVTKSLDMINQPVETAEGIVIGTRNILDMAKNMNVKSVVYLSSMEVYGNITSNDVKITEEKLGDINILNARSCYPLGKRMAENLCYSYYCEYGLPIKIARLAQVLGIGILAGENRVFTQFANAVRKGENIVLHTSGASMGNYCDSSDVIRALLLLAINGKNGEAYNIVNEATTMRISEMAELVANKVASGRIKVIYDIPKENIYGYADETGLCLSSEKICRLGWLPQTDLKEMYLKLIKWMDEMSSSPS